MQYIADSYQLYFPCDARLVRYLWKNGLHPGIKVFNHDRLSTPIIYSDNTISTIKKNAHLRKYAFPSEFSSVKSDKIGWKNKKNGVIIPSENFFVEIKDLGNTILIRNNSKSQYHLEYKYSSTTRMGQWSNWFSIYFPEQVAKELLFDLKGTPQPILETFHESKQTTGKREEFFYSKIDLLEYYFTYESFPMAKSLLEKNGFNKKYKGLFYDRDVKELKPFMKIGYVNTKETDGDFERDPQIAIKLSQLQKTQGTVLRGNLKNMNSDSYIKVEKKLFIKGLETAIDLLNRR